MMKHILETERLILRPWEDSDVDAIFDGLSDFDTAKMLVVPYPYTKKDAIEFLEKSKIKFDLIVAADVLCYLTNLPKLFQAVAEKLSEKGQFIFTIEKTEKENYELSLNGRVFHNFDYVKNELSASGLDISIKEKINLRREKDDFAKGYIIIAERK